MNPSMRFVAGGALIAYGVVAILPLRNPSLLVPVLYTAALIFLGFVYDGPSRSLAWLGIGICLVSSWSAPWVRQTLMPLLPPEQYAYIIPGLLTYAIFIAGNVILGASLRGGDLLHRSTGVILAIAAALSLFLDVFPYALVLLWMGYQLVRRPS
ncbi:MAG TPA: hypothetical protein VFI11_12365 [Anaerolineales bacterium]|nr:hypothetical protein [Anaerolineales bacterium]